MDLPVTAANQIADLETLGRLVPGCPGCEPFYTAPDPSAVIAPPHQPSPMCESGARPHCTCDRCF